MALGFNPATAPMFETHKLTRKHIGAEERIAPCILKYGKSETEEVVGNIHERLRLRLTAFVWAENLQKTEETVSIEVPADWWQHWKQDCAPAWFVKRWPVKMRKHERTAKFVVDAVFPNFTPHSERDAFEYRFVKHSALDWRDWVVSDTVH